MCTKYIRKINKKIFIFPHIIYSMQYSLYVKRNCIYSFIYVYASTQDTELYCSSLPAFKTKSPSKENTSIHTYSHAHTQEPGHPHICIMLFSF